ncbi:MAG: TolC family outer membrane protein [Acuticoccus sp.]
MVSVALPVGASSQTLTQSLAAAYNNNPDLNFARSQLREVDENIAIARSGNRPELVAGINQSLQTTRTILSTGTNGTRSAPTTLSLQLTQPLFRGFQTRNSIRAAESAVRAQTSSLNNTEQNVLLNTVTSFFDVIQFRQVVELRRSDVSFLAAQVSAAQDRFEVGEGTRTDVSQAEARQAEAESLLNIAVAELETAEATYRQLTGLPAGTLRNDISETRFLAPSLAAAIDAGQNNHPAIIATLHDVDTASFQVATLEGRFLPTLALVGEANTAFNGSSGFNQRDSASVSLDLSIPIYQGGRVSAEVRQAKEALGSSRIQVDITRDQVRQFTVSSWAQFQASVRSIQTSRTGVFAAQLALQGVIEEQRVGQRTTLDVLDSQRDVVSAQLTLVDAERNRDVAAYTVLAAMGRLNAARLTLPVSVYQPQEHTDAVRDKWFGTSTPDGR